MATFSFFNVGSSKSTLNAKADRPERFSMDSTLGETVAEPLAVEMFNQMEPGMLDGPHDPVCVWNDTGRADWSCTAGETDV